MGAGGGMFMEHEAGFKPFYCRAPGCDKRYKNLNGLKYHRKVDHPSMTLDDIKGVDL